MAVFINMKILYILQGVILQERYKRNTYFTKTV